MSRKKEENWVDFRKIMLEETGKKPAEPYLSRSSSNEEQGTLSITSFPSLDSAGSSCASSLSSDDNTTNVRGILKTSKRTLTKRSLLHSFERPRRNMDRFVENVLSYSSIRSENTESDESDSAQSKEKARGRKHTQSKGRKVRSLSLDRDKLHRSSLSIFSEGMACLRDNHSDTKSQQSSDERISLKSDLLGYGGHLRSGVRTAPKYRLVAYEKLITRRDNLLREFNRKQKKCIENVEYIFDKSHREIELALIDMRIDLAYSRH